MTFLGSPRGRGGSEPGLPEPALPAEAAQCPFTATWPIGTPCPLRRGLANSLRVLIPGQEACKGAFLPCKSWCAVEDEKQDM